MNSARVIGPGSLPSPIVSYRLVVGPLDSPTRSAECGVPQFSRVEMDAAAVVVAFTDDYIAAMAPPVVVDDDEVSCGQL